MKSVMTGVVALVAFLPSWCAAAVIFEAEPNNSLATAQDISKHFTLDFRADIGNGGSENTSTTIPHVTIRGSGDGTFDYYSFDFPGPGSTSGQVIFDIDYSSAGFDSYLAFWSSDGTLLFHNDDYPTYGGAGGSISDHDSLISTYITAPGTYIVGVARWKAGVGTGGFTGGYPDAEPESGDSYYLQVSVEGMPAVPEPSSFVLFGASTIGLMAYAWRRRRA